MTKSFKLFFLFLISFCALVVTPAAKAFDVPALSGSVIDQAGLLQPNSLQVISEDLYQFKAKTGVQIQVLIVKSLNDEPIENVAIQIFDTWKLGDKKKDNGILFLIAPNERKLRIEVGQGLEGAVPDVIAKRIIADVVAPQFKRGQFDLGIQSGVAALENYVVTGDEGMIAPETSRGKLPLSYLVIAGLIIFGIIFMISPVMAMQILFSLLSGGRGGGGGSGDGSGGGWSGGGGSSSGGGASGDW